MRKFTTAEKIILCSIGGVLNFLINFLFNFYLKIPLFLDTTFVITALFLFDFEWAIYTLSLFYAISAIVFTLLNSYTSYELFYAIGGFTFVAVYAFLFRKKTSLYGSTVSIFKTLLKASLIGAVAVSIAGGILNILYIDKFSDNYVPRRLYFIFFSHHINLPLSCILGRIPIFFLDRTITTFLAYAVFRLLTKSSEEKTK